MKQLYLLPILIFLVLTSCKENEEVEPLSEQIMGKWVSIKETHQYYDAEDKPIHVIIYDYHTYWDFVSDSTLHERWTPNATHQVLKYSLYKSDGKNYIDLKVSPYNLFEVKITGDRMTWVGKFMDQIYFEDNEDRTLVRAHHMIYTKEFERHW